jgi:hypothetical protein
MRGAWLVAVVALSALWLPGAAAAEVRSGSVTDPVEGTASPGRGFGAGGGGV